MKKDARFELVLPAHLHKSAKKLSDENGISLAYVIRNLIEKWQKGEVLLGDGILVEEATKENEVTFSSGCDPKLLYDFSIFASRHHISRKILLEQLMQAVVDGGIDLNDVVDK